MQLMDKMLQDLGDEDVGGRLPRVQRTLDQSEEQSVALCRSAAHAPSAKSSAQQSGSDLVAPQRSRKRPMPAPPSNPKVKLRFELPAAAEPEAPHEECAWPNPSELQPSDRAASPGTLMLLFSDVLKALEAEAAACPGSPVSTIDLECWSALQSPWATCPSVSLGWACRPTLPNGRRGRARRYLERGNHANTSCLGGHAMLTEVPGVGRRNHNVTSTTATQFGHDDKLDSSIKRAYMRPRSTNVWHSLSRVRWAQGGPSSCWVATSGQRATTTD